MKKKIYIVLLFYCSVVLITCTNNSNLVFEKNYELEKEVWDVNNKLNFEMDISDTISFHNFFINVRNRGDYSFSNLYLFINTTLADGKNFRDTVESILADPKGKWLGTSASGGIWDNRILFRKNVRNSG